MSNRYEIEEVWNIIGKDVLETKHYSRGQKNKENTIEVDGYDVYTHSLRYMTFYQKGCTCVVCGKEGTHFTLDEDSQNTARRHFNLRAEDGTLMTRDHILPKSKGGRDHISNMQTMCTHCNRAKGNSYSESLLDKTVNNIIGVNIDNPSKTIEYVDENRAIYELLNRAKVTQPVTKNQKLSYKLKKSVEVTLTFLNCLNSGVPYHNYLWYTRDKYQEVYSG